MTEWTKFGETGYTLLHVTQEGSPLTDSRVRCAMAYATDNQAIIDKINAGISQIANGPFSPGQLGNEAENGFPLKQDMAKAQELVKSYKADHPGPLDINLSTTQDATNLIIAQAQQQFFTEAGFDSVQISQIEQAKYILTALQGHSRPSSGATTAGSTSTPSTSGGTRRTRSRRSARTELRTHQGPGHRPGPRRRTAARPTRRRRRSWPRRSTSSSRPSATTSGAVHGVGARAHAEGARPRGLRGTVGREDLPLQRHPGRDQRPARSGSSSSARDHEQAHDGRPRAGRPSSRVCNGPALTPWQLQS